MLDVRWTRNLPEEKKESFASLVRNSSIILGRVEEILREEIDGRQARMFSEKDFDTPAWDYRQSYRNGYIAALRDVLFLIDLRR